MPWRSQLGEKIREAREGKGWSRRRLGRETDISDVTIGKYEEGKSAPQFDDLARICDALKVDHLAFEVNGHSVLLHTTRSTGKPSAPPEQLRLEFSPLTIKIGPGKVEFVIRGVAGRSAA
jgi:transcriptional regulator with XRE-family HTH domain